MPPHPAVCRQISSRMVNTKDNTIWEYFEENKTDTKFANCRNCKKKLAKGSELTAKLTTPNLNLHLKTVHPASHCQLVKKEMSKIGVEKEMSKTGAEKKKEMFKTGVEKEIAKTVGEKRKLINNVMKTARGER